MESLKFAIYCRAIAQYVLNKLKYSSRWSL